MRRCLTKEQILEVDDLKKKIIEVPEWDGPICVRTLTGIEMEDFLASLPDEDEEDEQEDNEQKIKKREKYLQFKLCARAICDENTGERIFSDEEFIAIGQKSSIAMMRVFNVVRKLNPLIEKDIKELEKNYDKTPEDSIISN